MKQAAIVIYSHGFGVRKDDRGLFTDIAQHLPNYRHIMFDYSQVDETAKTLIVTPLTDQAKKLGEVIAQTQTEYPDASIDLICHSQGCIAAALLQPRNIRAVIFTAPPATLDLERTLQHFANRPGSHIDIRGMSKLARADGSVTNVPPEYWQSREGINPIERYNELTKLTRLIVINAAEDEVIGSGNFAALSPNIGITEIAGGHNFAGDGRSRLIGTIQL